MRCHRFHVSVFWVLESRFSSLPPSLIIALIMEALLTVIDVRSRLSSSLQVQATFSEPQLHSSFFGFWVELNGGGRVAALVPTRLGGRIGGTCSV